MKQTFHCLIAAALFLTGCKGNNAIPDVSGIKVDLKIDRFDKDLFALDSNHLPEELPGLIQKYPAFTHLFLQQVLNLQQAADTPAVVIRELRRFLAQDQTLKDSVFRKFSSLDQLKATLENDFRFVKYYYPDYALPTIITFIGNFGGREIYSPDGLAIGLDFYMGSTFSYYQIPEVQEVYPAYLSRNFSQEYLPVNCMKAIVDDLYPDDNDTLPLIDQIVERGKRLYILDKFLPLTNDTLKLGYTGAQYNWCKASEGQIWNFFVQQNILYSFDPDVIKNYLSEAPTTQNMPPQSPGNIGSFVGEQIVRKYVSRQGGDLSPKKLMAVPTRTILTEAQYKP